jgi:hypothetical protein
MALQARAYERAGKLSSADAERFIESARSRVISDFGQQMLRGVTETAATR